MLDHDDIRGPASPGLAGLPARALRQAAILLLSATLVCGEAEGAADASGVTGSGAREAPALLFPRRPAPSPDGRSIAFSYQGDIWLAPSEGGAARRLTVHAAYETDPVWSPDGRWIAFSSDRDGNADVFALPVEGGEVRRLTWHSTWDLPCAWTPDGRGVLFNSSRHVRDGGASGLFVVPLAGGTPAAVLPTGANDGELSPDGARLAYVRGGESWWRRGYAGSARARLWLFTSGVEARAGEVLSRWIDAEGSAGAGSDSAAGRGAGGGTGHRDAGVAGLAERASTNAGLFAEAALLGGGAHADLSAHLAAGTGGGAPPAKQGAERDPHWLPDGRHLLYLSEEDGVANLRVLSVEDGQSYALTRYREGRLRAPAVSRDGTIVAFEYEDGLATVALPPPPPAGAADWPAPPPEPRRLRFSLPLDDPRAEEERLKVSAGAEEMALSPDGEQIAFVHRGEIFVMKASKDEPFANNVTRHPARDFQIAWSPDSKSILFVSDRTGDREIWSVRSADPKEPRLARALRFEARRLTESPAEDWRPAYDPAGRRIAFVRGTGMLMTMTAEGRDERVLNDGWSEVSFRWSPDGRWIAYSRNDDEYNPDVWIVPADGSGEPHNVSQHPADDEGARWSPDGKVLAFLSERRYLNQTDVWYVRLTREDDELSALDRQDRLAKKKEAAGDAKDATGSGPAGEPGSAGDSRDSKGAGNAKDANDAKSVKDSIVVRIDFDRIEERVRRLTSFPGTESEVIAAKDGSAFFFVSDTDGKRDLWKIKWDGTEPKRLTTGAEPSAVQLDAKGTKLYFLKSGGGIASIGVDGGEMTTYAYDGQMAVDRPVERGYVFDEAWRILRDRFYDAGMHGTDWTALRAKYRPWALGASSPRDFQDVVRMMLGELNASHLGISGGPGEAPAGGAATGELGVILDPWPVSGGLRVQAVLPRTPAERVESRLQPGDVLLAIDDRPLAPPLDLAQLLDRAADRKLLLSVRGSSGDARDVAIRPVASAAYRDALDRAEAEARRRYVERAGEGRLAYLEIESMDTGDLEEFERQLYAVAHGREALLIDVRGNNGGWITDLLLTCLMTPDHARTVPRGGRPAYPQDRRLLYSWNKPVVVLIDEQSFSNAEIFAWAIKTLKRGPLVGRRTHGGVISTGSTTLLDGSTLRLPGRGWYTLFDGSNEEGTGCPPDIEVENTPDDLARGIDRQLEAAVAEGMRLIGE